MEVLQQSKHYCCDAHHDHHGNFSLSRGGSDFAGSLGDYLDNFDLGNHEMGVDDTAENWLEH